MVVQFVEAVAVVICVFLFQNGGRISKAESLDDQIRNPFAGIGWCSIPEKKYYVCEKMRFYIFL